MEWQLHMSCLSRFLDRSGFLVASTNAMIPLIQHLPLNVSFKCPQSSLPSPTADFLSRVYKFSWPGISVSISYCLFSLPFSMVGFSVMVRFFFLSCLCVFVFLAINSSRFLRSPYHLLISYLYT